MAKSSLQPSFVPDDQGVPSIGARLADLVEAALSGEREVVRRLSSLIAQEYQGVDRREVYGRIASAVRQKSVSIDQMRGVERLPVDGKSRAPLMEERPWPSIPLILDGDYEAVLSRFIEEAANAERLSQAGLGTRCNLLLSGPPGTGKSFIAGHIAARLGLPFHVVRLDSVVSSLLGDTAKNIRSLFDFASHATSLIFLDEIDAIAKKRDDNREMGEIKRVVNTLIQGLDLLPERTVIVAATNHAHLLDPAIFRRFPYCVDIGLPAEPLRTALWGLYLFDDQACAANELLGKISDGLSCSDIRELAIATRRTALLQDAPLDLAALSWAIIHSEAGKLKMPPAGGLTAETKNELQTTLRESFDLTFKSIGNLLGVSKQAAIARAHRQSKKRSD